MQRAFRGSPTMHAMHAQPDIRVQWGVQARGVRLVVQLPQAWKRPHQCLEIISSRSDGREDWTREGRTVVSHRQVSRKPSTQITVDLVSCAPGYWQLECGVRTRRIGEGARRMQQGSRPHVRDQRMTSEVIQGQERLIGDRTATQGKLCCSWGVR